MPSPRQTSLIGALVVCAAVIIAVATSDRALPSRSASHMLSAPTVSVTSSGVPVVGSTPEIIPNATSTMTSDSQSPRDEPSNAQVSSTPSDDLAVQIDTLLEDESGVYGVVVMDQSGTITYSRNAETPFIAASLYKLVLLADIYRRIGDGELALSDELELLPAYFSDPPAQDGYFLPEAAGSTIPLSEAILATGAYSSNVSARALLALTDELALSELAASLGMTQSAFSVDLTDLSPWPPEAGADTSASDLATAVAFVEAQALDGPMMVTTPGDMARFFQKMLNGEVVNAEVSWSLFGILSQQVVNDRFPVLLPSGTGIIHKTGNLDHVVHDVGVIYAPAGPVILAALCEAATDDDRATEIIQQLALLAYAASSV